MARDDNGNNSAIAFLIGAAIGGAIALLSQKNVRDKLRDKYYEGIDMMGKKIQEASTTISDKAGDASDEMQDKLNQLGDEAEQKAKEYRERRRVQPPAA